MDTGGRPALAGLRVLDLSHHYAGALAAALLADHGAEVTCVEHPRGNTLRSMLPRSKETSLWPKIAGRGKKNISLDISTDRGRELLLRLAESRDVMIENFRPGTLERWGLGPEDLEREGLGLVLLRISGFGQTGPRRTRPGFGGVAEAYSGLAALSGSPEGPPVMLSTAIADGVAGTFGAFGVLAAVYAGLRDRQAAGVDVVDVSLFEPLFRLIPTQLLEVSALGRVPERTGGKIPEHGIIRNVYRSADGIWFCLSAVGAPAIRRTLLAIDAVSHIEQLDTGILGKPEVHEFVESADRLLGEWAGSRPFSRISTVLHEHGVVFERIHDARDISADEHYRARGDVVTVDDPDLGQLDVPGVIPKFPNRVTSVPWLGRAIGADSDDIYQRELGLSAAELAELRANHVV